MIRGADIRIFAGRLAALALLAGTGGCASFPYMQADEKEAQQREDRLMEQERMRRLEGRIEAMELEQRRQLDQIAALRQEQQEAARAANETRGGQAEALARRVDALEAARAKDRQDIVDALSREMAKLVGGSGGGGRTPPSRGGTQSGRNHTVKAGQSLSEIASAYGVKVNAIIDANQIKNPNLLRAGDILFIPDP